MATERWVDSFEAARICAFHNHEARPKKGQEQTHQRAMRNFQKAVDRGLVPKPHKKLGRCNLWNYRKLIEFMEGDGKPRRKNKKAESGGSRIQPEASTTPQRVDDGERTLPRRKTRVNSNALGEVDHG